MTDKEHHDCFSGECPTCGQECRQCDKEAILNFLAAQEKIYSDPRFPPIGANVLRAVRVSIRDGVYLRWKGTSSERRDHG